MKESYVRHERKVVKKDSFTEERKEIKRKEEKTSVQMTTTTERIS